MQTSHLSCDYDNTSTGLQLLLGKVFTVKKTISLAWVKNHVQSGLLIYLLFIIVKKKGHTFESYTLDFYLRILLISFCDVCGAT